MAMTTTKTALSGRDAARERVRSTHALADLYRRQGHLEAAELFLWNALELAEESLGPSDPESTAVRRSLAGLRPCASELTSPARPR